MMIKEYKHHKITTYPYGTNIFKVCENEMLLKNEFNEELNNKSQVPKNKITGNPR